MRCSLPLAIALWLCLFTPAALGQSATLTIGGVEISTGMSSDKALAGLAACCVLKSMDTPGLWQIRDKDQHASLGTIRVENGIVTRATRNWGPPMASQEKSVELANALYGLVTHLMQKHSNVSCSLDASEMNFEPGVSQKGVDFLCDDGEMISVIIDHSLDGDTASVSEVLNLRWQRHFKRSH